MPPFLSGARLSFEKLFSAPAGAMSICEASATALAQACETGPLMLEPLALKQLAVWVRDGLRFRAQAAAHFDVPGSRGATAQERRCERRGQALCRTTGRNGNA